MFKTCTFKTFLAKTFKRKKRPPILARVLGALLLLMLGFGVGCPPPLAALDLPEGCQPLAADLDCMLPYPSNYFLVPDDAMPTGQRVELSSVAKLITDEGFSADVADFRSFDGFSTTNSIVFTFGVAVDAAGLVGIFDDYADATRQESTTLLIDTRDGSLVPHFTDIDPRANEDSRRALIIRPQVALAEGTRYVVAVHGLTSPGGEPIAPPEGFRRLRDAQTSEDAALAALATRFDEEIFSVTDALGLTRSELQLAWDFSTGSDEHTLGDMFQARALALEALAGEMAPVIEITNVSEDPEDERFRVVFGQLTGPRVMEEDGAGQVLARDAAGDVAMNGTTTFRFRAVVPRSILDRPGPAPVLVYGHGFFGSHAASSDGEYNHQMLEEAGAVALMTDWLGMAESDIGEVISSVGGQTWRSLRFTDRVHQGVVNQLTLIDAIVTTMNDAEGFTHPGGGPLLDTENLTYFGISNGHILGGTLLPLDIHIDKWVLQVGGASYSQMMFRAIPFGRFLVLLDLRVPDALDQQKLHAQFQPQFDRIDPARLARYLDEPLPFGPADPRGEVKVLLQYGIGDSSVPNFTTELHARLLNVPMLEPAVREPFGLGTVAADPAPARAITLFDVGVDDGFYALAEPQEIITPVHNNLRLTPEVVTQTATLIREGRIIHPCEGPCVVSLP